MKKNTFGIVSSALSGVLMAVLFACNMPSANQTVPVNNNTSNIQDVKMTKYSLRGTIQSGNASGFTTKANFADIVSGASVTMLDLSGNALGPSVSTDANGAFVFTPTSTFTPVVNQIYVLESSKRAGANAAGSPLLALRTYVRWNGTTYNSITTPGIYLNTYTTALAIIAARNEITPASTIGTITVNGNTSTPTSIPASGGMAGADTTKINNVTRLVQQAINFQADPIATVSYNAGNYSLALSGTSNLAQNTQIDRLAIPSLNIVINGYNGFTKQAYDSLSMTKVMRDSAKDAYNAASPSGDVTNYRSFWTTALGAVFPNNQANASGIATALTPDVQTLDMTKATSFATLNGRLLSDDVVDVELKLLSGVNTATDGVNANDKTFSTTFPYLASPF